MARAPRGVPALKGARHPFRCSPPPPTGDAVGVCGVTGASERVSRHACAAVPTRPPAAEPGAPISGVVTDHTASARQGRDSNPDLSCLSRLVFSCFVVEFAQRITELVSVLLPLRRVRAWRLVVGRKATTHAFSSPPSPFSQRPTFYAHLTSAF